MHRIRVFATMEFVGLDDRRMTLLKKSDIFVDSRINEVNDNLLINKLECLLLPVLNNAESDI
jgi:hypothetical protein